MSRGPLASALVTMLFGFPWAIAAAQQQGAIEIGAHTRLTRFDDDIALASKVGPGGHVAYLVRRDLAVELWAAFSASRSGRPPAMGWGSYVPVTLRLVARDSLGPRTRVLFGGGIVHNSYGRELDGREYGAHLLVGLRWLLAQPIALRAEGVMDFMPSPMSGSTADFNFAVQLGASVQLTRVRPRDSDWDGIPNRLDRCPGTPRGMEVDPWGCPIEPDADLDGVPDAADRCPGTPIGIAVDRYGCPRFTDTARVAPPPPPPHGGHLGDGAAVTAPPGQRFHALLTGGGAGAGAAVAPAKPIAAPSRHSYIRTALPR
ncbi:MAG TPA: thrombospondin type 3 repeat-containing protein [Gemmatimonadaceae bacterium]|nr:thrombospondin type 3 repeat-containing protein [Gemmatimonadaceae bacterium]